MNNTNYLNYETFGVDPVYLFTKYLYVVFLAKEGIRAEKAPKNPLMCTSKDKVGIEIYFEEILFYLLLALCVDVLSDEFTLYLSFVLNLAKWFPNLWK